MLSDIVHGSLIASTQRRLLGRTLGVGLAVVLAAAPAFAGQPRVAKAKEPATKGASSKDAPIAKKRGPLTYQVGAGDTLGAIAERFHVRMADLCRENGLDPKQVLRAGHTLRLPSSTPTEPDAQTVTTADAPASKKALSDRTDARKAESSKSLPAKTIASKAEPGKGEPKQGEPSSSEAGKAEAGTLALRLGLADGKLSSAKLDSGKAPSKPPGGKNATLAKVIDELAPLGPAPVDKRALSRSKSGPSWLAYSARPKKRGYLELHSTVGRWRGQAVIDGWTIPEEARTGVTHVLASWRSGAEERIHGRLIRLLARVSDQFGGRPIRIVSGYRPHAEARFTPHSKHTLGRAVDFSIPGVPNEALRDYLRQSFQDVGIGYYPNSTHVHLDIREESTYWVDHSGPGQAPAYAGRARPRAAATRAPRTLSKALDSAVVRSLEALAGSTPRPPAASAPRADAGAGSVVTAPAPSEGPAAKADGPTATNTEKPPDVPAALNAPSPSDTHSPEDP